MSDRGESAEDQVYGAGLVLPVQVQVAGTPRWAEASECFEYLTVKEALEYALGAFEAYLGAASAHLWAHGAGGVSLYRRDDSTVVVVGRNALADAVRRTLPTKGWSSYPLPTPGIMLSVLREQLGTRTFALLRREGFISIEEVVAIPDSGLLDIRNMGLTTIATLRMVAAADRMGPGGGSVTLSAYHAGELLMLLKLLTTHAKPHRKDELAQAVATFLEDAFPAAGPGTTEVLDPGDLESS